MINDSESYHINLAKQLDKLDFPDVINLISKIDDGKYTVLPWINRIRSLLFTVNPYNLCRCCRTETLILPYCTNISNNTLVNLPYITSLTICSKNLLTSDIFCHLNYLKKLQILSHDRNIPDTLLDNSSVKHLKELRNIHVYNNKLIDEDFHHMRQLRIIVIESTNPQMTPKILNYLPKSEICIINNILYKYTDSTENNIIIKRIGKLAKIKLCH